MLHGTGKFTWADQVVYIGDFNYNKISGKGRYEWPDKSFYEGDVVDGYR